jgi:hypothetical protein
VSLCGEEKRRERGGRRSIYTVLVERVEESNRRKRQGKRRVKGVRGTECNMGGISNEKKLI